MTRKLYWDLALLTIILGGLSFFVFIQQRAPATEAPAVQQPSVCCGAAVGAGETLRPGAGAGCGVSASAAVKSDAFSPRVLPSGMPGPNKIVPETSQSEDAAAGGCGCGG